MNKNNDDLITEEVINKKILKIFKIYIPSMLILNILFIIAFSIYPELSQLNNFLIFVNILSIIITSIVLWNLDKKREKIIGRVKEEKVIVPTKIIIKNLFYGIILSILSGIIVISLIVLIYIGLPLVIATNNTFSFILFALTIIIFFIILYFIMKNLIKKIKGFFKL